MMRKYGMDDISDCLFDYFEEWSKVGACEAISARESQKLSEWLYQTGNLDWHEFFGFQIPVDLNIEEQLLEMRRHYA